jgi:FMN phosphatase YigB (HAD superfamily)
MQLRAVTFDFWSTLVDGTATPESTSRRVARLHAAIVGAGHACSLAEVERAYGSLLQRLDDSQGEAAVEIGPPGRWALLAEDLGIPDGLIPFAVVEKAYEDITLNPLPAAMPYVGSAVEAMRSAGYRLGVICNTGMAGGGVLREVLRRHGLLDAFDVTVFSNEFGVPKPQASIFLHALRELGSVSPAEALHVGDMEHLDVVGAKRAGMHSALYAPFGYVETEAEIVVRDWREFAAQIAALEG